MKGTIDRAIVVLNATGGVGGGVVDAALRSGRPVIAVGADEAALSALRRRHPDGDLWTLAAPIRSDADAADLAVRLRALGYPLHGVVAAIAGEHPCGRLLDQPADVLRRTLDEDLMPHLFAARHLFPLLPCSDAGGYVLVGGPGGDYPWAGYGHCSIAAAALRMMARVLHDEASRRGLRVQLLSLDAPVSTDANSDRAAPGWPKAVAIGRRALAMLDAHREASTTPVVGYRVGRDLTSKVIEPAPPPPASSSARRERTADADAVLPARDLHDARALLDAIASPHVPWNPQR